MKEITGEKLKRGRPSTGRVRFSVRVKPRTVMRIIGMIDDENDTPGKVVDMVFGKEVE